MAHPRPTRRARRGSYNAMLGFLLPVTIGFAALAVDTSWIRLADGQAQDVADAASHAALIELRRTGDTTAAADAADAIIERNIVGGNHATRGGIDFGFWDRASDTWDDTAPRPNAVRVEVGRYADDPVQLTFARIWGRDTATVEAGATTATRSLHVVLVMDITGSFHAEIHHAREAALRFMDILEDTHGQDDKIGMATFYYVYGHERSPLTFFEDASAMATMRADWETLDIASRISGTSPDPTNPGPRPSMPREYNGEQGTDHHVGMVVARDMLSAETDPFAYRAIVLLTDGQPINLGTSGIRDDIGYTETRWPEYEGPAPHSVADIKTSAVAQAQLAWENENAHVWTVTFRDENAFLKDMVQGDGKYYYTTNAAELVPIFEEIANSMPLVIVR